MSRVCQKCIVNIGVGKKRRQKVDERDTDRTKKKYSQQDKKGFV